MTKQKYYIVTAYRWGDRECHSYVIGLFDKKHAAIEAAKAEEDWRGRKYECQVREFEISKKHTPRSVLLGKPVFNEKI